jgi:predicted permease
MDALLQDVKFGARLLWRDRGFTMTAALTLAICIGANAAMFTVIRSVLLRPLPVPESDRLVLVYNSYPGAGVERGDTSVPDYFDRLGGVPAFEAQALYVARGRNVGEEGRPERVQEMQVTPSFFRLIGVQPQLGRAFTDEEGEIGAEQKVMLSDALWRRLFGGDPQVVGRQLRLNGAPYEVVGVMPPRFHFLDPDIDLWSPLAFTAEQKSDAARHSNNWTSILKAGATIEEAQAQIDAVTATGIERTPELKSILANAGFHTRAVPLQADLVRDVRRQLYLLWGGVICVLLIGGVNVANLALVRATARLREMAARAALGAGSRRLARQLATESALLSLLAAGAGLALGYGALGALEAFGVSQLPRGAEVRMDGVVVAYTLAAATRSFEKKAGPVRRAAARGSRGARSSPPRSASRSSCCSAPACSSRASGPPLASTPASIRATC